MLTAFSVNIVFCSKLSKVLKKMGYGKDARRDFFRGNGFSKVLQVSDSEKCILLAILHRGDRFKQYTEGICSGTTVGGDRWSDAENAIFEHLESRSWQ